MVNKLIGYLKGFIKELTELPKKRAFIDKYLDPSNNIISAKIMGPVGDGVTSLIPSKPTSNNRIKFGPGLLCQRLDSFLVEFQTSQGEVVMNFSYSRGNNIRDDEPSVRVFPHGEHKRNQKDTIGFAPNGYFAHDAHKIKRFVEFILAPKNIRKISFPKDSNENEAKRFFFNGTKPGDIA